MAYLNESAIPRTGIKAMDKDHLWLAGVVNDLHASMKKRRGSEEVGAVLEKLVEYAFMHFRLEEELMQRHHYPDIDEHRALHEEFIVQVDAMSRGSSPLLPMQVQRFLERWFHSHISGADMKLAEFLKSRGIS